MGETVYSEVIWCKITKNDGTPFKVYSPFWRNAEQYYLERLPDKINKVKKCKKIEVLFKKQIKSEEILPKSKWYMKFEKYWIPSEKKAHEYLDNFVNKNILNYGLDRDFPSINGTSKLSPYIRNGQINVGNIWEKCKKLKSKNISVKKKLIIKVMY